MGEKNTGTPLMITKTPIVVRDYFENIIPGAVNWDLNPYIVHDRSLRSPILTGANLVSERIRYRYYLNKRVYDDPDEPLQIQVKKPLTKGTLKENTLFKSQDSNELSKLNKAVEESKGDVYYGKKSVKAKSMRIKYYGNAYSLARQQPDILHEEPKEKYNSKNSDLTLKELFKSNNMTKVLCAVHSKPTTPKSYSKTSKNSQMFNNSDLILEKEKQQRNELIKRYGNRPLSHFISPHKVNKITDLPEMMKIAMNWRLARVYKKLGTSDKQSKETEEQDIDLSLLNRKLLDKLLVSEKKTVAIKDRVKSRCEEIEEMPSISLEDKVGNKKVQATLNIRPDTDFASTDTDFLKEKEELPKRHKSGAFKKYSESISKVTINQISNKDITEKITIVKERAKKLKEMVKSLNNIEEEDNFHELTQQDIRGMLSYRKSDTNMEIKNYLLAKNMVTSKNCKALQKNYGMKTIKRDKIRIKLALDNKETNINDIFKTQLNRKKVDAAFSKAFYKQRKKQIRLQPHIIINQL